MHIHNPICKRCIQQIDAVYSENLAAFICALNAVLHRQACVWIFTTTRQLLCNFVFICDYCNIFVYGIPLRNKGPNTYASIHRQNFLGEHALNKDRNFAEGESGKWIWISHKLRGGCRRRVSGIWILRYWVCVWAWKDEGRLCGKVVCGWCEGDSLHIRQM